MVRDRVTLTLAAVLGIIIALVLAVAAWTAHSSITSCQRVDKLELIAQASDRRALTTLPTLAYYREHPDELKDQIQILNDQIAAFTPESCSLFS